MPNPRKTTRIPAVKILENNKFELSNMQSSLTNANSKKDLSICMQNIAAYFYADDHDNFWTLHKDLKMQFVTTIASKNGFECKHQLLTLLDQALRLIETDIQQSQTCN